MLCRAGVPAVTAADLSGGLAPPSMRAVATWSAKAQTARIEGGLIRRLLIPRECAHRDAGNWNRELAPGEARDLELRERDADC